MRRRYEIYIVRTLRFKLREYLRKANNRDFSAVFFGGNLEILSKNAAQVAAAEKHRSGAFRAGYARFFAEMQCRTCDVYIFGHTAKAEAAAAS